ncbi:MAG TPA: rhodanese-like domain-containing protein [Bryobacteraceae bacterium]|nr:rhodanese-like domain-containing protein [Bryobacteraceae bacterium]
MPAEDPFEITPQEVQALRASGESLSFLDVREPQEWETARIEGATLIPMGVVPATIQAIESKADEASLIVYCHHGVRSLQVVSWLRQQGIACCYSLAGGIDRWSREIDPSVARY